MSTRSRPAGRSTGRRRSTAAAVAVALALSGCSLFGDDGGNASGTGGDAGSGGADGSDAELAAEQVLRLSSSNLPIIDPQVVTFGMWMSAKGIFEGLVVQNEDGTDVLPGMAESWEVSDDGLTYTFHIREDAAWSNGDPLTAEDFERTYQRLFTPEAGETGGSTSGANSYQSATNIKGATDFLEGATDDWSEVGVRAVDERVLEIEVASPTPGFLLAMTHPSMLPLHMDTVEEHPQDWQEAEHIVSNGPFMIDQWVTNSSMELVPNPHYWDTDNVHLDRIEIALLEGGTTGAATVPYENDEVDIVGLANADIIRMESDPELADHVQIAPSVSYVYLATLRSENPLLEDVNIRKALSLALDREYIAEVTPDAQPGRSLVLGIVPGYDESIEVNEDVEEAQGLLAEAGYPDGEGFPEINLLAGSSNVDVEAIVDSWRRNLGIDAKADTVETGVLVERRWAVQDEDYVGFYYGSFAGTPDWPTMVGSLWSPRDIQEFSLPADVWAEYQEVQADGELSISERNAELAEMLDEHASDASHELADLVDQAMNSADEAEQQELFTQAAQLREEQHLIIPVLWKDRYFAVRPTVQGLNLRPSSDAYYFKGISIAADEQ
ncbi:peptide ABC transporter substrate-binding protein [Phytoactinopolyspora halotolerans]|uniref:Peptide ABC transporter substrate-binding protein n=1 Tax=Phytoactinopolyspora halotolerans TaxID=1981512 RepID=A0A6L9SHM9_9ACTN|nr:peptide ABC transporter substrate-binding protein [Phytoactinopolyspora halotolerans]NEE04643.1 peptide ABC transporter substrate-binding protein [Phytoactinopolyspora halotolerans]